MRTVFYKFMKSNWSR